MLLGQLRQAAKLDWATDGDSNSAFFHAMIRQRRRENTIHALVDMQGQVIDEPGLLKQHIVSFYKGLLGSSEAVLPVDAHVFDRGPKLSDATHQMLLAGYCSGGEECSVVHSK